jgi:hypothetical protein
MSQTRLERRAVKESAAASPRAQSEPTLSRRNDTPTIATARSGTAVRGEVGAALAPAEEATEEVSGVVTEDGEPVEGLSVTEVESDQSATTGADGIYTLEGVPAGRPSNLFLTKAGAKVATARLDLLRSRSAVADFEPQARSGA